MELLQLMYFCDAAETENFSRTAQRYHVPPSNISQSIKRLEAELSVKLFDRISNRIFLNEQGKTFYQKVKQALSLLEDAKTELADSEERGSIRLFVQTNRRIVMQTVQAFRLANPMVDIVTSHSVYADSKEFHLIVGDEAFADSGLQRKKLLSENLYLAMSQNSPLVGTRDLAALEAEPFISMGPGTSIHTITMDIFKKWGISPQIAIQSDDPFYIRKCVALGLGMAIIPSVSWKGQFSEDIHLQKIDCPPRNTYVYWDDKKYLPASARAFLQMLIEAFRAEGDASISL